MQQESVLINAYSNSNVFNICNKQSCMESIIWGLLTNRSANNLISGVVLEETIVIRILTVNNK